MPGVLSGISPDATAQLTAGTAAYQPSTVRMSPVSPSVGPDFRGPFEKPEPGPNSTIEVKQEWTSMRIDVRRDLLADVAVAVLDTIAGFNPRTASGAREILAQIIAFKDRLIGLIEPGTWTIRQQWSFTFKAEGNHTVVVHPTISAAGWTNDTGYFGWTLRLDTVLNGATAGGEAESDPESRALDTATLVPDPAFAAPAFTGMNTVEQTLLANVEFVGYQAEFQATLAALDRAASFLSNKINEIWAWFSSLMDSIMSDTTLTPEQTEAARIAAEAERTRREAAAGAHAGGMAEDARAPARSAVDRLRAHQAYFDVDFCRTRVIAVSGDVPTTQLIIDGNHAALAQAAAERQLGQIRDEAFRELRTGPSELRSVDGTEAGVATEIAISNAKEVLRHKLAMRELIVKHALAKARSDEM